MTQKSAGKWKFPMKRVWFCAQTKKVRVEAAYFSSKWVHGGRLEIDCVEVWLNHSIFTKTWKILIDDEDYVSNITNLNGDLHKLNETIKSSNFWIYSSLSLVLPTLNIRFIGKYNLFFYHILSICIAWIKRAQ